MLIHYEGYIVYFFFSLVSHEDYLKEFDSSKHGPLQDQPFVEKVMNGFFKSIYSYNSEYCNVCNELWPTCKKPTMNENDGTSSYTCKKFLDAAKRSKYHPNGRPGLYIYICI